MRKYHEKDFSTDKYDEFYESHYFEPLPDEDAIMAHRIFPRVAWALDRAKEFQPTKVLDLGCLEGYTVLTILKHIPDAEGVGVDLSEDGVTLGGKRAAKYDLKATFYQTSIEKFMETTDDTFDFITAFEVMEHVEDPERVFKLIDRIKSPDGLVLISTPDFEGPVFGKDDEQNKCHIRLYTTEDEDYQAMNKYGNVRTATSLSKQIGKERIKEMGVYSHLINCLYV